MIEFMGIVIMKIIVFKRSMMKMKMMKQNYFHPILNQILLVKNFKKMKIFDQEQETKVIEL